MDVAGGGEAEAAGELCAQVADDVPKEIAGHDDIELPGIADDLHRQRVDVEMTGIDLRVLRADFLEDTLPQVVGKVHSIGLVAHAHALQTVVPGVFEGVANNALDALAGINVFLDGDFVGGALLEESSDAHVEALAALPEDHQPDVFLGAVAQRCQPVVEQFDGPGVDVEVEFETKPQQDIGGVLIRRNARVPERAKKNSVEFIAQHFDGTDWEAYALAQKLVRAPVEFDEFHGPLSWRGNRPQRLHRLRRDFSADAVTRNHGDTSRGAAISQRDAGQALASSTAGFPAVRSTVWNETAEQVVAAVPPPRYSSIKAKFAPPALRSSSLEGV